LTPAPAYATTIHLVGRQTHRPSGMKRDKQALHWSPDAQRGAECDQGQRAVPTAGLLLSGRQRGSGKVPPVGASARRRPCRWPAAAARSRSATGQRRAASGSGRPATPARRIQRLSSLSRHCHLRFLRCLSRSAPRQRSETGRSSRPRCSGSARPSSCPGSSGLVAHCERDRQASLGRSRGLDLAHGAWPRRRLVWLLAASS